MIQSHHNVSLPDWATLEVRNRLQDVVYRNFADLFGLAEPKSLEKTRLTGGSLLKTIVEQMQLKVDCLRKPDNASECRWINRLKLFGVSAVSLTFRYESLSHDF
jgi:hypothetical protein